LTSCYYPDTLKGLAASDDDFTLLAPAYFGFQAAKHDVKGFPSYTAEEQR
jgi:hypothetical protein